MIVILEKYQFFMKFLGLDPRSGWQNMLRRTIISFIMISSVLFPSIIVVSKIRDDFKTALVTLPLALSFTAVVPAYFHLLMNCERIFSLLDDLQAIVNERSEIDKMKKMIYATAEQRITSVSNKIMNGISSITITYLSPFVLVAFHWCTGKYTIESWLLIFPIWTPMEQNTALNRAIIVLIELLITGTVVYVVGTVFCLLNGIIEFEKACFLDLNSIFACVDRVSKREESASKQIEYIKEAIVLHEQVNRFMSELKDLMNFIILVTVTPWALCVCLGLFLVVTYSGTDFLTDLQLPVLAAIAPVILFYMYFSLGQIFHSQTKALTDEIYAAKWYRYSHNAQGFIQLMIQRSQRPFYLGAYGIVTLTLENYVALLRWIYSAFMLLIRVQSH